MKISCPSCGTKFILEDYIRDENVRAVLRMPQEFGSHWKIALEYCELWNLGSPRKWGKLYRLLHEVLGIIRAEEFKFQRRSYPISAGGVAEALRLVCNQNLKGPVTSHGYLRKVMISISEQEAEKRRKEDEANLRKRERDLRAGVRDPGPGVPESPERGDGAGTAPPPGPAPLGGLIRSFVRQLEGGRKDLPEEKVDR